MNGSGGSGTRGETIGQLGLSSCGYNPPVQVRIDIFRLRGWSRGGYGHPTAVHPPESNLSSSMGPQGAMYFPLHTLCNG